MRTICIAFSCNMSLPIRSIHARVLFRPHSFDSMPHILETDFQTAIFPNSRTYTLQFPPKIIKDIHVLRWIHLFLLIALMLFENTLCIMFWSHWNWSLTFRSCVQSRTSVWHWCNCCCCCYHFAERILLLKSLSDSHSFDVENSWKHFTNTFSGSLFDAIVFDFRQFSNLSTDKIQMISIAMCNRNTRHNGNSYCIIGGKSSMVLACYLNMLYTHDTPYGDYVYVGRFL